MRVLANLIAGVCLVALGAAWATPVAPEPATAPELETVEPSTFPAESVPPHIARLNLPPAAQSRGPVEALLPVTPATGDDAPADGIRRCARPDGTAVFTDRRCEEMGAVPSAAPSAGLGGSRLFVRNCARSHEALVDGLREALEMHDANRVASYYHWSGMGNRAAYALMDRLQDFSERPLMDVRLVVSTEVFGSPRDPYENEWNPLPAPFETLPPPPPPRADLVRIDQTRGYDDASAQVTYLRLTANAGCWWVHF